MTRWRLRNVNAILIGMTYAIFSDMHGNWPALRAALADAKTRGAQAYLFLGDYYRDFPWADEVARAIKGSPNHTAVRGNNEDYLDGGRGDGKDEPKGLLDEDRDTWTSEQFYPIYKGVRDISAETLDYFLSLPRSAEITDGPHKIYLAHTNDAFIRRPKILPFSSSGYRGIMRDKPFTRSEYLAFAKEAVLAHKDSKAMLDALPKGVYLFGHNHLQFHMEYDGRLFINPGSCGVSLDGDAGASYSLLELNDAGWSVLERKVKYDIDEAAAAFYDPRYGFDAPAWREVYMLQLTRAYDYFGSFIHHIENIGLEYGETVVPLSNRVFRIACEAWDPDKIIFPL